MEQQQLPPIQQESQAPLQTNRPTEYLFDESDIDFLTECIAKTLVDQTQQEVISIEGSNEIKETEKEEKVHILPEGESEENAIKEQQVSPEEKEMVDEMKELVFGGLSFGKQRKKFNLVKDDEQGGSESADMFVIDWVQLEQLPLYQVDNSAKQFRMYPTLSQRLKLETIIAAHYHQMSGIPLQTYSSGLTLPNHAFTPSELQQTVCAMLLTTYRHLESYVKRKLRTDIVRVEGEDVAQVLRMLVRVREWKARKCAHAWQKFILYAYDLNEQAGEDSDIKDLYVFIQAYAHNEQYAHKASQIEQSSTVLDQNQELSFCQLFLERQSFPGAVYEFNKKYNSQQSQFTLRHNFELILTKALKMLAEVLQRWKLYDSVPPFLKEIDRKTLMRHSSGHELRLKLISMYTAGQPSSSAVAESISALREFLIKTDRNESKQTISQSKQKSTQPIQEESEKEARSNQSNQRGSKNHASRTRLSRMLDEEYDIQNQVDLNRDHKGRFTHKKSSKPQNGLPFQKQKTPSFGQDPLGRNRLKLMSKYQ